MPTIDFTDDEDEYAAVTAAIRRAIEDDLVSSRPGRSAPFMWARARDGIFLLLLCRLVSRKVGLNPYTASIHADSPARGFFFRSSSFLARHGERDPAVIRDGVLRELAVGAWRGLSHSDISCEHDSLEAPPRRG
jgi:hypothetical protein